MNPRGYSTCGALLGMGIMQCCDGVCDDRLMGVPFVVLGIGDRRTVVGNNDVPSN